MPSGQYTAITLTQAVSTLAARVMDQGLVHWTWDELADLIRQALRTWNALTGTYKATVTFNTSDPALNTATPFFDLGLVAPGPRGLTVTTDQAVNQLCDWLQEPHPTGLVWNGTSQFSYSDVVAALERRRDQFLLTTAVICTRTLAPIAPPPDGRVPLDEAIVTLRRAAWVTAGGSVTPIQRDDEWSANAYAPSWPQNTRQTPRVFSVAVEQPLYMQLIPPPNDTGTLDLCTVNRGATLGPGVLLGVPDDWAWVVFFGALADLLSRDGLALDPQRAQYAEARWQHGLQLASEAGVILTARVENRPVRVAALPDLDQFSRTWQNGTGTPRAVATLGHNLFVCTPPPSVNAPSGWGVTLDLVRNAPLPINAGAFIQIGPEYVDTVLDYAQHIALVKEGGTQIQSVMPLLDRFFLAARVQVAWQAALQRQRAALHGQTSQDRRGTAPVLQASVTGSVPGEPV